MLLVVSVMLLLLLSDHQVKDAPQGFPGEGVAEVASPHEPLEDFQRDVPHPDLQSDMQREDPTGGDSYGSFYTPPLSLLRQVRS